jgi:hypothetical protein
LLIFEEMFVRGSLTRLLCFLGRDVIEARTFKRRGGAGGGTIVGIT